MHPQIKSNKPGKCSICGMDLTKTTSNDHAQQSKFETYRPLLIIISLITTPVCAIAIQEILLGNFMWQESMTNFMAGFFLVFSGFKLLDLKGFAHGYATYDLLARKFPKYGYIYPFLELGLGLAFLMRLGPMEWVNIATILLMGFSGLGVLESLSKKRKFQCACLGTIIKVPLTSVTLIEDFGMAAMAIIMLFLGS